jgi:flagellar basal-body rod protein FlgB
MKSKLRSEFLPEGNMDILDSIGAKMAFGFKRHEVLAGNIANAQTPGYIPKDVTSSASFAGALALARTSSGHLSAGDSGPHVVSNRAAGVELASLDGNGVDLEKERALLAQNALDLQAQMRFATHYLRQKQIVSG